MERQRESDATKIKWMIIKRMCKRERRIKVRREEGEKMIQLDVKGTEGARKIKSERKVKREGGNGWFTGERQRESFSLKAPFAPASVPFRKQFALRTVVPPYIRHLLVDPTDWQKKDWRVGRGGSLRLSDEVNSECKG